MTGFESNLDLIKNLEFRQIRISFQGKLKNDKEYITKSDKIFVFANKSRNIDEVKLEQYKKLLKENITKNYEEPNLTKLNNINNKGKKIIAKLTI